MNRNVLYLGLSILMLLTCPLNGLAQSLHAIVFCNTLDEKIGCDIDEEKILDELTTISTVTGLEYKPYVKHGEECTKENLYKIIDELDCKVNDVIFMYYSGHGSHSAQQTNEPFPQMCLKYNFKDQDKFVSVKAIDEKISNKRPRLMFIITDCCNNISSGLRPRTMLENIEGSTFENETIKNVYKKLFVDFKGKVKMTGSKLGQYSYGGKPDGGTFTRALINSLLKAENADIAADWKIIAEETKKKAMELSGNKQEPYYEIYTTISPQPSILPQTPNLNPPINISSTSLEAQLQYLLDKRIRESSRLQHIPLILNGYFTAGAKVKTVGRNLTTIIAYEDAEEFLRRITASPYIKGISIVRQADNGKNNEITVHEIRIQ